MDEPVAEETKRRLLSALLLKVYQPISVSAHEIQKKANTKPAMGLERFDPFHSMHYEQSQSAQTNWLDILEERADDPPPRRYEVLIVEFSGAVYESGKNWTAQSIFDTPLGRLPPPAGLVVSGLFLSLLRKDVCSKQECAQLDVCNFSKMMVHRESLTQIGVRAEKKVAKQVLAENGWERNLVADISKVDYLEGH